MAEYKKRRKDRKEGRYLRDLDPYYAFTPFIMKDKNDATNYFSDSIEITEVEKTLRRLRLEGMTGVGMLHLFVAAYIWTVSQYPAINRFISGQRIYARDNIEFVMSIKKGMSTKDGETSIKVIFDPADTLPVVYKKLNEAIAAGRAPEGTSTDAVAGKLIKLPRWLLRTAIRFLDWMDYHGWLPQMILDASPFHGSFIITDLGSLGIPPVVHHLYNFGNLPVFLAFGAKRKAYELTKDGTVAQRKYVDYTAVTDERICDGYYFARAFKQFKHSFKNVDDLFQPPAEVIEDDGK